MLDVLTTVRTPGTVSLYKVTLTLLFSGKHGITALPFSLGLI